MSYKYYSLAGIIIKNTTKNYVDSEISTIRTQISGGISL